MISFIRCDDRIIHGQVVTRWSMERKCDGIIAVNDAAANSPLLRQALKASSTKKTFVWTREMFLSKMAEAIKSDKCYFVITKEPLMMLQLMQDGMTVDTDILNVGPQSAKDNTINVNKNCGITIEQIKAYEEITKLGYDVQFQLVPDETLVKYSSVRGKLLENL